MFLLLLGPTVLHPKLRRSLCSKLKAGDPIYSVCFPRTLAENLGRRQPYNTAEKLTRPGELTRMYMTLRTAWPNHMTRGVDN